MFIVAFAKFVKYVSRRDNDDLDRDEYYSEENESIAPGIRRFIWLGVKHGKKSIFGGLVSVPTSHYLMPGYSYGIGYFGLIYAPVCGLFFNYMHEDLEGEGPYYLNGGYSNPARVKRNRFLDRF